MERKYQDLPLLLVVLVLFGASIGILHGRIKNKLENHTLALRHVNKSVL